MASFSKRACLFRWLFFLGADLQFTFRGSRIIPVRLRVILRYDTGDRSQHISFIQMDEPDPLSDTSGYSNLGHRGTDDYAVPGNQHDFVLGKDFHHAHDITRPIGPFIGALIFVLLRTFTLDFLVAIGLDGNRFRLLIGLGFLVIVLFSPDGIVGLWERWRGRGGGPAEPGGGHGHG